MSPFGGLGPLRRAALILMASVLVLAGTACGGGGNRGFPKEAGQYEIVKGTLAFDGKDYELAWLDAAGSSHQAKGRDVRMQKDDRTFLEIADGSPLIHLKEDEGVIVRGRDKDGMFESPWFPFFIGYALGGLGNSPTTYYPGDARSRGAGYHYPPSDSFGRGDQLNGSVERSKPETPDYGKVKPAPHAVSGQGSGTGGGAAATNKATAPSAGQSGGTGTGSAASGKGGFANGSGTGVGGGASWGSGSKSGSGSASAPSRPSSPPKVGIPSKRR
jgi:hypothetical protein